MLKLYEIYYNKVLKAYELYNDSLNHLSKIDVKNLKTSLELEPLDAFNSRFERLVELILSKYTKSIELIETWINEWTLRDRLNLLEKIWLISNVDLWLEMRWLRNKIALDYIEDAIFDLYFIILRKYNSEIQNFIKNIKQYKIK